MEKKSYVRPRTEVVLMRVQHHLLEDSPIHGGGSGEGYEPDSRRNNSWDED